LSLSEGNPVNSREVISLAKKLKNYLYKKIYMQLAGYLKLLRLNKDITKIDEDYYIKYFAKTD